MKLHQNRDSINRTPATPTSLTSSTAAMPMPSTDDAQVAAERAAKGYMGYAYAWGGTHPL